jgi:prepilin-type N-terminal cleavage/methylation domain-containing protein
VSCWAFHLGLLTNLGLQSTFSFYPPLFLRCAGKVCRQGYFCTVFNIYLMNSNLNYFSTDGMEKSEMMRYGRIQPGRAASRLRAPRSQGFSMIEMVLVVAIILILTVIAVPLLTTTLNYLRLRGAVSSVTGAIQSSRYQAIAQGCQYQVVFDAVAGTFQVQNEPQVPAVPATVPPSTVCAAVFSNVCAGGGAGPCPVPLSGSGTPVTLGASITLTFTPGGQVLNGGAACSPSCAMSITYAGKSGNLTISRYGNVNIVYP